MKEERGKKIQRLDGGAKEQSRRINNDEILMMKKKSLWMKGCRVLKGGMVGH